MKAIWKHCLGLWTTDTQAKHVCTQRSIRLSLWHVRHAGRRDAIRDGLGPHKRDRSEYRRRMILDTERYLSNPRNLAWAKLVELPLKGR